MTQAQMIYRDTHDGPSSCVQFLSRLHLLTFLPIVQLVLPLDLVVLLLAVVAENSLQDLVAGTATDDMLHMRQKEVQQHKQSQIADILQDLEQLAGELVQAVLVLVVVDSCSDHMQQLAAGHPWRGTSGSPT